MKLKHFCENPDAANFYTGLPHATKETKKPRNKKNAT